MVAWICMAIVLFSSVADVGGGPAAARMKDHQVRVTTNLSACPLPRRDPAQIAAA